MLPILNFERTMKSKNYNTCKFVIQFCNTIDDTCLNMYYSAFKNGTVIWVSKARQALSFPDKNVAEQYANMIIPHKDWKVFKINN